MSDLATRIREHRAAPGTAAVVWLGQGGFLVKSPAGVTAMIDPYFSDYCELIWGLKRLRPAPLDPAAFAPDLLLSTHWHEDHLDRPTVVTYAGSPGVTLVAPFSCLARATGWGWPAERQVRLEQGMTCTHRDITITATFARHHQPLAVVPDAVGFLLDVGGVRLWNVGDSEYDARLRGYRGERIDAMFVPINGVGGNMDVDEAAFLAWRVAPRGAMPTHYDMWAPEGFGPGATLDPARFGETLARLGAATTPRIMTVGEIMTVAASAPTAPEEPR